METKVCSGKYGCGQEKPLVEFDKNWKAKDGLSSYCKTCSKKYRAENKERIEEQTEIWRAENKERILEQRKKYRAENKNKERKTKRMKIWRAENKERILDTRKKYSENLAHGYIRGRIKSNTGIKNVPDFLINYKKAEITAKRELRKRKKSSLGDKNI